MKYRTLGKTNISVSVVAMGCWSIVGSPTWGKQDEKDSIETIKKALDLGVNFFDTAEEYEYGDGSSESLLGKALTNCRHKAVISSKVSSSHLSANEIQLACENSLKRLNRDYIDLYQIHWPNRNIPFAETIGALGKLKEQGKIRAIGVSNFGVEDLSNFLAIGH